MTENGLDSAQVSAVTDHVSRATMAQHVRTGLLVRLCFAHNPPDSFSCKACPTSVHEDQRGSARPAKLRTRIAQVSLQSVAGRDSERDDAFFITFAADNRGRRLQVEVFQAQIHHFGNAHSGRV